MNTRMTFLEENCPVKYVCVIGSQQFSIRGTASPPEGDCDSSKWDVAANTPEVWKGLSVLETCVFKLFGAEPDTNQC